MFKDSDGKWYVAIIGYNPYDHSQMSFKRAENFFVPGQIASTVDKYEAFEHLKKWVAEEFFGED